MSAGQFTALVCITAFFATLLLVVDQRAVEHNRLLLKVIDLLEHKP